MRSRILEDRQVLHRLRASLSDPRFLLAEKQQALDEWSLRLERVAHKFTQEPSRALSAMDRRLASCHPHAVLGRARAALTPLNQRMVGLVAKRTTASRAKVAVLEGRLLALSPLAVLSRGYAIALSADGRVLRRSGDIGAGAPLRLLLHHGSLTARVTEVTEPLETGAPEST
jgi:exodeoxyribonuclease VII large subunit